MAHTVKWYDRGKNPQVKPNPDYPNGKDVDAGERPACKVELPYPAKRIGYYLVECGTCGTHILITTAGRPDDPRSVMVPCKVKI